MRDEPGRKLDDERLAALDPLHDPVRRSLYLYVAAQPHEVSRDETAGAAGRPAKLYRRSSRDHEVSLPPRHYRLVAELLAQAVD